MPSLARSTAAFVVGLVCTVTDVLPARAEAWLASDAGGTLSEAEHRLDIAIEGYVARVSARQTLANGADVAAEVGYGFELPLDAVIVDLAVTIDGQRSTTAVVDAERAYATADPDAVEARADTALLRMTAQDAGGPGARASYELRLAPIPAGKTATSTITWLQPLRYDDGRLSLRLPSRGEDAHLVRERVTVTLRPPAGAKGFSSVHAPGARVTRQGGSYRFTAPVRADIVVEAVPELSAAALHAEVATVSLGADRGAIAMAVAASPAGGRAGLDFGRIVFVVDVSRSMGAAGLKAAAELVDAMLGAAPAGARVDAILFDRHARRVLGELRPNTLEVRKELGRALQLGQLANGSDLGAALTLAGGVATAAAEADERDDDVRGERPTRTLVVVVSDGMAPLDLDGERAADHFGTAAEQVAEVVSITLVPDEAPVPGTHQMPAAHLAHRTGGRALALRLGEVGARAGNLAAELRRPPPVTELSLVADGADLTDLGPIADLEAGRGAVLIGFYRGREPKTVRVRGLRGGDRIEVSARRSKPLTRAALALALPRATLLDFLAPEADAQAGGADREAEVEARRRWLQTTARARAVTPQSALAALPAADRFARDRLALVERWGPSAYVRMPPPSEHAGWTPPSFTYRTARAAADQEPFRRTGELDGPIIERLLRTQLVPKARACYERALRADPSLRGRLTVEVELARGEVQRARIARSDVGGGVEACVVDAAYDLPVPAVALGDEPETVGVARYPLTFRPTDSGARVDPGPRPKPIDPNQPVDVDNPLGGLEVD